MRKFIHTIVIKFTTLKQFVKSIEIKGLDETTWQLQTKYDLNLIILM